MVLTWRQYQRSLIFVAKFWKEPESWLDFNTTATKTPVVRRTVHTYLPIAKAIAKTVSMLIRMLFHPPWSGSNVKYCFGPCFLLKGDS